MWLPFICVQYKFFKVYFLAGTYFALIHFSARILFKLFLLDASHLGHCNTQPDLSQPCTLLSLLSTTVGKYTPTAMHAAASENSWNSRFLSRVYRLSVWRHFWVILLHIKWTTLEDDNWSKSWLRTTLDLDHLPAVQSWAISIHTLCLSFIIQKLRLIIFPSKSKYDGYMR